jgi:hypothetical protein
VPLDLVAVAAAVLLLDDVARVGEFGDGRVGAALGDIERGGDVSQAYAGLWAMQTRARAWLVKKFHYGGKQLVERNRSRDRRDLDVGRCHALLLRAGDALSRHRRVILPAAYRTAPAAIAIAATKVTMMNPGPRYTVVWPFSPEEPPRTAAATNSDAM